MIDVTFINQSLYSGKEEVFKVRKESIQVIGNFQIMISGQWFKVKEPKEYFLDKPVLKTSRKKK